MISVGRQIRNDFAAGRRQLVLCDLAFKAVTLAILGPIVAWVISYLIALSGQAAISNFEIAHFLLSPLGLITVVLFSGLTWGMVLLSQSALLLIQVGRACQQRQSLSQSIIATIRRGTSIVQLALLYVALFLLVASPFLLVAGATYQLLLGEFDINYYLSEMPTEMWMALGIGGVLGLGLLVAWSSMYARTLFALPECVLRLQTPTRSLKTSYRMTQGHVWNIFKCVMAWLVIYLGVAMVVGVSIQVIESVSLATAGGSASLVALTIGFLLTLNLVAGTLVGVFGNITHTLLIGRLYLLPLVDSEAGSADKPEFPGLGGTDRAASSPQPIAASAWLQGRRALLLFVLGLVASSAVFCGILVSAMQSEDVVRITAHRGSSKAAPENTLAAIEQAIIDGADYIEIDVQETSDGVVVVIHDSDFMRIAGRPQNLWDTTYAEVANIDAGSWFDPKFADERIPSLSEVIQLVSGRAKLNIELKFNGHQQQLVARTLDVIEQQDFAQQCVISSLKHESLSRVRSINSEIPVGAIVGAAIGDLSRLDVDFVSISRDHVHRGRIRRLHDSGKEIHVWTVNDRDKMSDMLDLGVDNILTDEPAVLRDLLEERQRLTTVERMLLTFRKLLQY